MLNLKIREICPDSRMFRADGQRLRKAIECSWNDAGPIVIDFEGEIIASIAFLDEGIATLFVDYESELIRRRLQIVGMTEGDRHQLNILVSRRRTENSKPLAEVISPSPGIGVGLSLEGTMVFFPSSDEDYD